LATCASKPTVLRLTLASPEAAPIGSGPAKLRIYRLKSNEAKIAAECACCAAQMRTRAAWEASDMRRCLPPNLTPEVCE
jgi:hypothetical protein